MIQKTQRHFVRITPTVLMSIALACIMMVFSAFAPLGGGAGNGRSGFATAAYAATSDEKIAEVNALLLILDELQTELNLINTEYELAVAVRTDAEQRMNDALMREVFATERISELQEQLGSLAAQMYRNGPVSFLEVFFGAQSFSDFVAALEMNNRINAHRADLIAECKIMRAEAETARIVYAAQQKIAAEKEAEIKIIVDQRQIVVDSMIESISILQQEAAELLIQEQLEAAAAEARRIAEERRQQGFDGPVDPYYATRVPKLVFPFPNYVYVSSSFGWRYGEFHNGIDLAGPAGSNILAAAGGTVIAAGWHWSMGNYIKIAHGGGVQTIYMHCQALYVYAGSSVYAGQVIGAVGSTGNSSGAHLHFQLEVDGLAINPIGFL
ncbi:MAG: peptidoglycan DD-metalloendopeptidase family protein [Coriobacteriia bacterium]|nr:peptidoglycan DD-metalloendopeptidase family protein [Coriobacteriia bacterium]